MPDKLFFFFVPQLKIRQRKHMLFTGKRENMVLSLGTKVQFSAIGLVMNHLLI